MLAATKPRLPLFYRQNGWFLRRMRMLVTRIDLQFPEHLFAELGLGKHALNGFFHDAGWLFRAHPLETFLHQPARIPGEMAVYLVFLFPAAQPDLRRVDDDHVIARI